MELPRSQSLTTTSAAPVAASHAPAAQHDGATIPSADLAEIDSIPDQLQADIKRYVTSGTNKRARLRKLQAHITEQIGDQQEDRESLCRGPSGASVEMNTPKTVEQWEATLSSLETRRTAGERFTASDRHLTQKLDAWFATNYKRVLFVYFALEGDPLRAALTEEAETVRTALGSSSFIDVDFVSDISISQLVFLLADARESPYHFLHFSGHGHGDEGGKSAN